MNITITGSRGLLGSELSQKLNLRNNVTGIDLPEYDISDFSAIERVINENKPDIIINCAAFTNVDLCESEKKQAFMANSYGVSMLSILCEKYNIKLIHFSTDYVFNGEVGLNNINDVPDPINYYGRTKLYGEFEILKRKSINSNIVRTNVLYGSKGNANFINWLNNSLKTGKKVKIVDDQYNNPCYIDDIVDFTQFLIDNNIWNNIFHTGSSDYMNRFEFALKFAEIMGYDVSLISPVSTAEFNQTALRPLRGGLDITETEKKTGFKFSKTEKNFIKLKKILKVNDLNI